MCTQLRIGAQGATPLITHVIPIRKYEKHSAWPSTSGPWVRTYSKLLSSKSVLTVCKLSPCHTRVASSRRLHGVQEKLRTPRCAQWDLLERRGIAVASLWHLHWTPWGLLGRHATARTLCMHRVRAVARRSHGDLNERRVNAVGSQRQRSNSAVRSPRAPRGRRGRAVGTHMIAARTPPYTTGMLWRD